MPSLTQKMQSAHGSIKAYRERRRAARVLAAMEVALVEIMEASWPEVYWMEIERAAIYRNR